MSRPVPCAPWATETDILPSCDTTAIHPEVLAAALSFASTVVYNLTQRRWPGLCTDSIDVLCGAVDWCHGGIELPATDVRAITEIKVDGVAMAASDYELREGRRVIAKRRADGTIVGFPWSSDLSAADDAIGRFTIEYTHGAAPPSDGVKAVAIYGYEFALGWTPDCAASCRLPKRVTTVSRAGMTFSVIDPLTVLENGGTGLPDVDALIFSLNRGEARQRATVLRPGSEPKASRTL